MNITIPELSLVVLIGPSGCGKSSFARAHFKPTEVLSSDFCRGLVSDDENAQAATKDAFEVLHFVARRDLLAAASRSLTPQMFSRRHVSRWSLSLVSSMFCQLRSCLTYRRSSATNVTRTDKTDSLVLT